MTDQNEDDEYHKEVEGIVDALRDACAGHEHQKVLHAISSLLVDCADEEFFTSSMSLDARINGLMAAMTSLVRVMAEPRLKWRRQMMGWNDHVTFQDTECLDCGATSTWEYWDEVGKQRYVGAVGQLLGVDAGKSGKCPDCGSTRGRVLDEDEWS